MDLREPATNDESYYCCSSTIMHSHANNVLLSMLATHFYVRNHAPYNMQTLLSKQWTHSYVTYECTPMQAMHPPHAT